MNKLLDQNINRIWSSLIIDEILKNNIDTFYLSPGMRNAPLIAALVHLKQFYPTLTIHLCVDERAASYRALGYSKATSKPSVLICTSGTAMANYMPAVIESKKSNLPLIIISADRPSELTFCDDNQTIDQTKFYGQFIQGELNLGAPSIDISPLAMTSSLSNLIHKALYPQMGPVHFNCPFREPLEDTVTSIPLEYKKLAENQILRKGPSTEYLKLETRLSENALIKLKDEIIKVKTGLLIIGSLGANEDKEVIKSFIKHLNWPTYFDVSSSLKYEFNLNKESPIVNFPTFDHPEVQEDLLRDPPDTIIHIGGRLTSKHYYTYLKQVPGINLITISLNKEKEDPSHHTKIRVNADIASTLQDLIKIIGTYHYQSKLNISFDQFALKKIDIINKGPLSFPKISKTIIDHIKNQSILYLGNSTAVRSFDSYFSYENKKEITIATNRGVSGIEGFMAGATGLIDGLKKEVYLVIGDITFIHDLNSLYFLKQIKIPLKIILINNFSGGIFTLLPIHKEKDVLNYVASPHDIKFENAAKLVDIKYLSVNHEDELKSKFLELQNLNEHALLEIFLDNDINKSVYDQLRTIKL
jgi:2-succinyl-5-enolpyruvyl-6-hydroxy-3-cyclohexene-1-carboxylate synthase